MKSNRRSRILPPPPRVVICNAKSLKDRLVRLKLKPKSDVTTGNFDCGSKRCEICKILVPGNEFKSFVTKKSSLSYTVCGRQYTDTRVARLRERFNQHKSNVSLYSQGIRGLMLEKMISHFFDFEHNGSIDDMHFQIIDHCDPNDKERRESIKIEKLKTMHPYGLKFK